MKGFEALCQTIASVRTDFSYNTCQWRGCRVRGLNKLVMTPSIHMLHLNKTLLVYNDLLKPSFKPHFHLHLIWSPGHQQRWKKVCKWRVNQGQDKASPRVPCKIYCHALHLCSVSISTKPTNVMVDKQKCRRVRDPELTEQASKCWMFAILGYHGTGSQVNRAQPA